jgi:AhpD family alkylhydroperoxidase
MTTTPALQARLDYQHASPEAAKAMFQLEHVVRNSGLDPQLLELIRIRASQMNGCAYCIDMHTKDARRRGETEQRIYALSAWAEAPFYTEKERAVLAWTEALTNIQQGHAPDEVYEEVARHFAERELMNLTLAITTINAWNRIALGFRIVPGSYQPSTPHPSPPEAQ